MKKSLRIFALLAALCVLMSGFSAFAECGYISARNLVISAMDTEIDLTGLEFVGKASMGDDSFTARVEANANGDTALGANMLVDNENFALTIDGMQTGFALSIEELLSLMQQGGMNFNPADVNAIGEAIIADEAVQNAAMSLLMPLMSVEPQDLGTQKVMMVYGEYDCAVSEYTLAPEAVDALLNGIFDLVSAVMNVEEIKPLLASADVNIEEARAEMMEAVGGKIGITVDIYTSEYGMMVAADVKAGDETALTATFTMDASDTVSCGVFSVNVGDDTLTAALEFTDTPFANGADTVVTVTVDDVVLFSLNKQSADLTVEGAQVAGDTLECMMNADGSTIALNVSRAELADGRVYKYIIAEIPETARFAAEAIKTGNVADVSITANADGMDVAMSATFEAGSSEETLAVSTDGLTLIDPMTMTEEQSDAFMEELSTVAMGALFKLAAIPGIAGLLG